MWIFCFRACDWEDVENALFAKGYKRHSAVLVNKKFMAYFTHHAEYQGKVALDLHWHLTRDSAYKIDYDKVWCDKKEVVFRGSAHHVLSDEYQLIFQILSIFQDVRLGYINLRSFIDLYMMIRILDQKISWKDFFEVRKKECTFSISLNICDWMMDFMSSYDEFPELAEYIRGKSGFLKCNNIDEKFSIFERSDYAWKNKQLAFLIAQGSIINYFLWWAISLPFRLHMHPRGKKQKRCI